MTTRRNSSLNQADSNVNTGIKRSNVLVTFAYVVSIGFIFMFAFIAHAILIGNLTVEGRALIDMPWGRVSLLDIYLGLLLFSFWVLWREKFSIAGFCWSFLIIILGNLASCIYILKSCREANWEMKRFWLGRHFTGADRDA